MRKCSYVLPKMVEPQIATHILEVGRHENFSKCRVMIEEYHTWVQECSYYTLEVLKAKIRPPCRITLLPRSYYILYITLNT